MSIELKVGLESKLNPTPDDIRDAILSCTTKNSVTLEKSDGQRLRYDCFLSPAIEYTPASGSPISYCMKLPTGSAITALTRFGEGDPDWSEGIKLKTKGAAGCMWQTSVGVIVVGLTVYVMAHLL